MDTKVMERLELIEDKIEDIKWLIATYFSMGKTGVPSAINIIKKSAGILGKNLPKGTAFENKIRKEWQTNFLRRITP